MLFRKKTEQLSSGAVLKNEEEFLLIFERVIKFDNERMIHSNKDISLSHNVSLLFSFLDIFFFENFHGVDFIIILSFFFNKNNFGIGSFSYDRQHIKIIKSKVIIVVGGKHKEI